VLEPDSPTTPKRRGPPAGVYPARARQSQGGRPLGVETRLVDLTFRRLEAGRGRWGHQEGVHGGKLLEERAGGEAEPEVRPR
jgi:hypothetical protein